MPRVIESINLQSTADIRFDDTPLAQMRCLDETLYLLFEYILIK